MKAITTYDHKEVIKVEKIPTITLYLSYEDGENVQSALYDLLFSPTVVDEEKRKLIARFRGLLVDEVINIELNWVKE